MADQLGRDEYGYVSNLHVEATVLSLSRLEARERECYDAGIRV
jgi:hypothetical protein